jgi:ribose 5-phosphate isomerase
MHYRSMGSRARQAVLSTTQTAEHAIDALSRMLMQRGWTLHLIPTSRGIQFVVTDRAGNELYTANTMDLLAVIHDFMAG